MLEHVLAHVEELCRREVVAMPQVMDDITNIAGGQRRCHRSTGKNRSGGIRQIDVIGECEVFAELVPFPQAR